MLKVFFIIGLQFFQLLLLSVVHCHQFCLCLLVNWCLPHWSAWACLWELYDYLGFLIFARVGVKGFLWVKIFSSPPQSAIFRRQVLKLIEIVRQSDLYWIPRNGTFLRQFPQQAPTPPAHNIQDKQSWEPPSTIPSFPSTLWDQVSISCPHVCKLSSFLLCWKSRSSFWSRYRSLSLRFYNGWNLHWIANRPTVSSWWPISSSPRPQ